MKELSQELSRGLDLRHRLRPDALRARVDRGGRAHARSRRSCSSCWSSSCSCRPGARRSFRSPPCRSRWSAPSRVMKPVRLLDQRAVALRAGARDRHRRRRRHRRGRERRAQHRARPARRARPPRRAMDEVSGPIIAIALVLCAVFVPIGFIPGLTGQFYRQFALTIAISTVISAFNSLTLSPALAARAAARARRAEGPADARHGSRVRLVLPAVQPLLRRRRRNGYVGVVRGILRRSGVALVAYGGLLALTWCRLHQGADRLRADAGQAVPGRRSRSCPTPPRSIAPTTVIRRMSKIALATEGVAHAIAFPGLVDRRASATARTPASSSSASKPFEERKREGLSGPAIAATLEPEVRRRSRTRSSAVFPPPPVQGLGTIGGFKLYVEDRGDVGLDGALRRHPEAAGRRPRRSQSSPVCSRAIRSTCRSCSPTSIARRPRPHGVAVTDVFETMQAYLGSVYVNDFNRFGRTFQVDGAGRRARTG